MDSLRTRLSVLYVARRYTDTLQGRLGGEASFSKSTLGELSSQALENRLRWASC